MSPSLEQSDEGITKCFTYKKVGIIIATYEFIVIFDFFLGIAPWNHPHLAVAMYVKKSHQSFLLRLQKAIYVLNFFFRHG